MMLLIGPKIETRYFEKFICFHPHHDNPNIGLSNKDQELQDKLKIPDFIEKKKLNSPTPPSNPSGSSTNYKKPAVEIPPVDIDRSQTQFFYYFK
jgi:hypothetical protein